MSGFEAQEIMQKNKNHRKSRKIDFHRINIALRRMFIGVILNAES